MNNIRSFSIIAHIDHGKSTLADRIIEHGDSRDNYKEVKRLLDNMELEQERGITIKLNAVKIEYKDYILNLIDTPGHVDFSYEVSRSLAACEGALLIIDAAQGIEAQTLANLYLAIENDLEIIPVVNKIDLPNANIPKVLKEIKDVLGFNEEDVILASGKTGDGIKDIIEAVIDRIPAPNEESSEDKALIFDSYYDPYKGVIAAISVKSGSFNKGDTIKMFHNDEEYEIVELWENTPEPVFTDKLSAGRVGFINASIKTIDHVKIGDTITTTKSEAKEALEGYKEMMPTVFSGIYPVEPNQYNHLREALEKLKLNDSSLTFEPESSNALGFGFRCGFLGLLHLEIIEERITREFDIEVITTSPSVIYEIDLTNGETIKIDNPSMFPEVTNIEKIKEPYIKAEILTPNEFIGPVMELCQSKRGIYTTTEFIDESRMNIKYELPLAEIVYDFYDKLKSFTSGYASFDYEISGYKESDLVKLDILINGDVVDALSVITHREVSQYKGRAITKKLRELIPRQLFEIPIQASIGSNVISRENVKAMRKNVIAKCYGGDVTRKKKLLEKQKEGKKKMKMVGNVEIPKEAFLSVLSNEE